MSQNLGRIQSKNCDFLKFHSILFKTMLFLAVPPPANPGAAASGSYGRKG